MTTETKTTNSILNLQPYRKSIRRSLLLWLVFLPLAVIIIIPLIYIVSRAFTHRIESVPFPNRVDSRSDHICQLYPHLFRCDPAGDEMVCQ